ncbi:MAG TPA: helix-turn-helix transcriptional regulator [Streptosporangiaceae bacterium]
MGARDSLNPRGSLWDLIAVQLRRHREQAKMSGTRLGDLLDLDRSSVSRLESGGIKLQEKHAKVVDHEWQTDELFAVLVHHARTGHVSEWLQAHLELEARSSELRIWELAWIPGLFQTEAYARAIFTAFARDDIDHWVTARMARQQTLDRTPRPLIWAYLDQGVINQPVGGPEVMREQLARLLELAQQPNIRIRVIPRSVGAHVGRDGSFKIMTVAGGDQIYTEASEGGRLSADGTDVRLFRTHFTRIGDDALPVGDSLKLIQETMETFQ